MNPTYNLLVLRPSDLLPTRENVPINQIEPPDFRATPRALNEADAILYIDGTRTRFLKDNYDKSGSHPYKPSTFGTRTADVSVVGDSLFCTFPADEELGIEAGLLISPPWTKEDNDRARPDDDVLGVTVSRPNEAGVDVMFHDIGFFIPDYTSTDGP